jgi:hypothetical protein
VIDANGVIRDNGLVFFQESLYGTSTSDKMIEALVAEAEKASKK